MISKKYFNFNKSKCFPGDYLKIGFVERYLLFIALYNKNRPL